MIFLGSLSFLRLVDRVLDMLRLPTNDSVYIVFLRQDNEDTYFVAIPPRRVGFGLTGPTYRTQR